MLQSIIDFIMQNPDAIDQIKNGAISLDGLTDIERQALMEMLNDEGISPLNYWQ